MKRLVLLLLLILCVSTFIFLFTNCGGGGGTCTDADGDGFFVEADCSGAQDCDDDPATGFSINPGAEEICDGIDNNCDSQIDEGFPQSVADGTLDCNSGVTNLTCDGGYVSCDGEDTNGCEVQLTGYANTPATAQDLGSAAGDETCTALCTTANWVPAYTWNGRGGRYFRYRAVETSDCAANIQARITLNVPTGVDYDLRVTGGDNCSGAGCSSTNSGSTTEQIIVFANETFGPDDSFDIDIEVSYYGGSSCANYTLTVEGTNCP